MTGFTAAFTQMTGAKTNNSNADHIKEQEVINKILNDSDGKLADFIKYDTTLGRDQNIEINKESSLANIEKMRDKMLGGVKLT